MFNRQFLYQQHNNKTGSTTGVAKNNNTDHSAHNAQLLKDCQALLAAIKHGLLTDVERLFHKYKDHYDDQQVLIHFKDHQVSSCT